MQMTDRYGELAICWEKGWGRTRDWMALPKSDRAELIAYLGVSEYLRELDREQREREAKVGG